MLEIKTIIEAVKDAPQFDRAVNDALADGWALVRRDVIPAGLPDSPRLLYAELEQEVEVEEEDDEDDEDDAFTSWQLAKRNPVTPFRCEKCGFLSPEPLPNGCPNCGRAIRRTE